MASKTTSNVKDGHLNVFTGGARVPGVHSWGLDQVSAGGFELAPAENEGLALVFKSGGKKAVETVAVYNNGKDAEQALKTIFDALSNRNKKSGIGKVLKVIGVIVVVLFLLSFIATLFASGPSLESDNGVALTGETEEAAPESVELPVGEAFPVNDFIRKTGDVPVQD